MIGPSLAIGWQLWARYRVYLCCFAAYLLVATPLVHLLPDTWTGHALRFYLALPVAISPLLLFAVFLFGAVEPTHKAFDNARCPGKSRDTFAKLCGIGGLWFQGVIVVAAPVGISGPLFRIEPAPDQGGIGRQGAIAGVRFAAGRDVVDWRVVAAQHRRYLVR